MNSIVFIDPFRFGHHPAYLKLFSEAALSLGCNVTLCCPDAYAMREKILSASHHSQNGFRCIEINEPPRSSFPARILQPALNAFSLWRAADKTLQKVLMETGMHPDLVFFPWLDSYLSNFQSRYVLDRIFPYRWSGLIFHPCHLRQPIWALPLRRGPLDFDECLNSSRCRAVGVLDEGIAFKLQSKLKGKPVVIFPDVTDSTIPDSQFPVAHRIAAQAQGRKIISLLGSLEKRKGLLPLLEIARGAECEDLFFLFAGKIIESTFTGDEMVLIRSVVAKPPGNCFFHFDYINEEAQFNKLVEMSDILCAVYDGFLHSSNILTKAALYEKPVIVAAGHCMDERVKKYHLGVSVQYGNQVEYTEALRALADGTADDVAQRDFKGYRLVHSKDRLASALKSVMKYYDM